MIRIRLITAGSGGPFWIWNSIYSMDDCWSGPQWMDRENGAYVCVCVCCSETLCIIDDKYSRQGYRALMHRTSIQSQAYCVSHYITQQPQPICSAHTLGRIFDQGWGSNRPDKKCHMITWLQHSKSLKPTCNSLTYIFKAGQEQPETTFFEKWLKGMQN